MKSVKRADIKAIAAAQLTDTQRVVLLALIAATDREDTSISGLCEHYTLKRSAVAKAVKSLKEAGIIGTKDGTGRRQLYIKALDETSLRGQIKMDV